LSINNIKSIFLKIKNYSSYWSSWKSSER